MAAIAITVVVLMLLFRNQTATSFEAEAARKGIRGNATFFRTTVAGLVALAIAYIAGAASLWPLGVIAAIGGVALLVIAILNGGLSR